MKWERNFDWVDILADKECSFDIHHIDTEHIEETHLVVYQV